MPLLKIQTNKPLETGAARSLAEAASAAVAGMLGKPERYVMVSVEHNPAMLFGGDDAPLAYLELKSIGLPENRTAQFSATLADLVEQQLGVPADRVYIEFADALRHLWGWDGGTF
jgi:phenylpyruvate tautomerase PptA (4-oxalocrotonate tautomerase family)